MSSSISDRTKIASKIAGAGWMKLMGEGVTTIGERERPKNERYRKKAFKRFCLGMPLLVPDDTLTTNENETDRRKKIMTKTHSAGTGKRHV